MDDSIRVGRLAIDLSGAVDDMQGQELLEAVYGVAGGYVVGLHSRGVELLPLLGWNVHCQLRPLYGRIQELVTTTLEKQHSLDGSTDRGAVPGWNT